MRAFRRDNYLRLYAGVFVCISELGIGWAPAIINSASELIAIRKIQDKMHDGHSYWIGGSTFVKYDKLVTYYDYITTYTG